MSYNKDWIDYYVFLEVLRQSGATNMFGAAKYLKVAYGDELPTNARAILASWMDNYDQLIEDGILRRD